MYINLAKIVAECLRYRDYSVESHNLLIEIEKKDGDIKMIQKDLARYNEEYNPVRRWPSRTSSSASSRPT